MSRIDHCVAICRVRLQVCYSAGRLDCGDGAGELAEGYTGCVWRRSVTKGGRSIRGLPGKNCSTGGKWGSDHDDNQENEVEAPRQVKVLHSPIFGPFDGVLNVNNHDFPSFLDFDGVDQDTTTRHANGNGYW